MRYFHEIGSFIRSASLAALYLHPLMSIHPTLLSPIFLSYLNFLMFYSTLYLFWNLFLLDLFVIQYIFPLNPSYFLILNPFYRFLIFISLFFYFVHKNLFLSFLTNLKNTTLTWRYCPLQSFFLISNLLDFDDLKI